MVPTIRENNTDMHNQQVSVRKTRSHTDSHQGRIGHTKSYKNVYRNRMTLVCFLGGHVGCLNSPYERGSGSTVTEENSVFSYGKKEIGSRSQVIDTMVMKYRRT